MANLSYIMSRAKSLKDKSVQWEKELSVGEMQRLAFARLFFHNPKWAILDESTSALDRNNEDIIYRNLKKLDITFISVSHRETVKIFHKNIVILTLNNGF
jgi:vitamin B12/bleomycin/antimicrobial peptide transport system ATP-binding/permease protein